MSPTATPLTTTAMQGQSRRRRTTATGSSGAGRRTLAIVEKELDEEKKKNADLQAENTTLKAAVAKAQADKETSDGKDTIPEPEDKKTPLFVRMGFKETPEDEQLYGAIARTVHERSFGVVDFNYTYRQQSTERLMKIFKAVKQAHPILVRYQNNWPTAALLRQFINNRRKYLRSIGALGANTPAMAPQPAAPAAPAPTPVAATGGVAVPNIGDVEQQEGGGEEQNDD